MKFTNTAGVLLAATLAGLMATSPAAAQRYKRVKTVATHGNGLGQIIRPHFVAIDSAGDAYVASSDGNCIQKFSIDGTPIWKSSGIFNPPSVAISPDGRIYATSYWWDQVLTFDSNTGIELFRFGTYGNSTPGTLDKPQSIVYHPEGYLVVNTGHRGTIAKFDLNGTFLGEFRNQYMMYQTIAVDPDGFIWSREENSEKRSVRFTSDGNRVSAFSIHHPTIGEFKGDFVTGPVVDGNGILYFTEFQVPGNVRARVFRYNRRGQYLGSFTDDTVNPGIFQPSSVAMNRDGRLWVASGTTISGSDTNLSIYEIEYPKYRIKTTFGSYGNGPGQLRTPWGLTFTPDKKLVVSESTGDRIQIFDDSGNSLFSIGATGSNPGQFRFPTGVAVANDGNLIVSDRDNHRIQCFSPDGTFLREFGSLGAELGSFNGPHSIGVDLDGDLFIADFWNQRIVRTDVNGSKFSVLGTSGVPDGNVNFPIGLAIDQAGRLVVTDRDVHRVHWLNKSGQLHRTMGTNGTRDSEFNYPYGVTVAPNGMVAIADECNSRIQILDPGGNHLQTLVLPGSGVGNAPQPEGITFHPENGQLYVADAANHRIVVLEPYYASDSPDPTAPTSTHTVSPTTPASTWHSTTPVTVNVTATDNTDGSGVKEIRYSVNMGAEQVVAGASAAVPIAGEGIHTVAYWAVDNAGNVEATKYATVRIDKTAPAVAANVVDRVLTITANDTLSGVKTVSYRIDNGAPQTYSAPVSLPSTAKMITFWAVDNAGNSAPNQTVAAAAFLKSLTITPSPVASGTTAVATVNLLVPAPAGGLTLSIASDAPGVLPFPSTVTVGAGATKATFSAVAAVVAADTMVQVRVSLGEQRLSRGILVQLPTPKSVTVAPSAVVGGANATGTVTLTAKAPAGGLVVALQSLEPTVATVPATVTVPAGAVSKTFPVATNPVASDRAVLLTATVDGDTAAGMLRVRGVGLLSATMNPKSVVGGSSASVRVTLNRAAPTGGIVVALSVAGSGASVAPTVTVPGGTISANVPITTSPVADDVTVSVRAQLAGTSARAELTIGAPRLASVGLVPSTVKAGDSATGLVTLTGKAPASGITVMLKSSHGSVGVVSSVVVPAGAVSVSFPVTTTAGTAATATITATHNTDTKTATLQVRL